jgi:hypothetical protein
MKTLPLRTLLREPTTIKKLTTSGQSVQITDNGKPLWIVQAAPVPNLDRLTDAELDEELNSMLAERFSQISASALVLDARS